jgi:DnaJ-class molecular chaperone
MTRNEAENILGVSQEASDKQIKSAYRKLAQQYHPDKTGGDDTKFKEVNEAYAILSGKQQSEDERYSHFNSGPGIDLGDLFGSMGFGFGGFGGHRPQKKQRPQPVESKDIQVNFNINLEQVLKGTTSKIAVNKKKKCEKCKGVGGKSIKECGGCKGAGSIFVTKNRGGGMFFRQQLPCKHCQTEGYIIQDRCAECNGQGVIDYQETYELKLTGEKK